MYSSIFSKNSTQALIKSLALCASLIGGASAWAQPVDLAYDLLVDIDTTEIVPNPDAPPATIVIDYFNSPSGTSVRPLITVVNDGPDDSPPRTISFSVPLTTSLQFTEGTITNCTPGLVTVPGGGPFPIAEGTVVTCDVPPLAEGESATLRPDLLTTVETAFDIDATIPDDPNDTNDGNNNNAKSITVFEALDLAVTIPPVPSVASGSFFDFQVDVENLGPSTADSYTVTVPVPAGVINITPPAGCSLSGANFVCNITAALADGESAAPLVFNGQMAVASTSDVSLQASISGSDPLDFNPANDAISVPLEVTAGTDIAVDSKVRTPAGTLLVGDEVAFEISTSYTGDAPGPVTLTDIVPANYDIISVTQTGSWACTDPRPTPQTVECASPGTGLAGAGVDLGTITIVATVVGTDADDVQNTATIALADGNTQIETNTDNNVGTDIPVDIRVPFVDLAARKGGPSPRLAVVGNPYPYFISTVNVGNADFFGTLTMTDIVPAGLEVNSLVIPAGFTCTVGGVPYDDLVAADFPIAGPETYVCSTTYTSPDSLAPNESSGIVRFNTTVVSAGDISNTLDVRGFVLDGLGNSVPLDEPNFGNNSITVTVAASDPAASADISTAKRAGLPGGAPAVATGAPTATAGEPYLFELEIRNDGPVAALDVDVTDVFENLQDGSVPFISVTYANTPAGTCTESGSGSTRTLECTIVSIPVCGASPLAACPVITVVAVPGGDLNPRDNSFEAISQLTPDPNLANNESTVAFPFEPRHDLTVSKTAPGTSSAGVNLEYIISALNIDNGLSRAENVIVEDTLPADVTFISAIKAGGGACEIAPAANTVTTSTGNNLILCELGTLNQGVQRNVTVIVRPNFETFGETIINSVEVKRQTGPGGTIIEPEDDILETVATNNDFDVETVIVAPSVDLQIRKTDDTDPVLIGGLVNYTVTVQNGGPSASQDIVTTDNWPDDRIEFVSVTPPVGGTCDAIDAATFDPVTDRIVCRFPSLEVGGSFDYVVSGRAITKGTATNRASVSSVEVAADFDRLAGNNATRENTTVRTRADVFVEKVASTNAVNLREPFNFTVTVGVNPGVGLDEADGVVMTDTLPAGMILNGTPTALASNGTPIVDACLATIAPNRISCALGTIFPTGTAGQITSVDVTIPVIVTSVSSDPASINNTASVVTEGSLEDITGNNSSTGTVTVASSSIAGNVFADFANDTSFGGSDFDIANVPVTLTGVAFDGSAIEITVNTNGNGDFLFDFLPEGNYTLSRGIVPEPYFEDGIVTSGSNNPGGVPATNPGGPTGTVNGNTIVNIALPPDTDNIDNIFRVIPQARLGIAKAGVVGPQIGGTGVVPVTFTLVIENFSLETLINISVDDELADNAVSNPFGLGSFSPGTATAGTYDVQQFAEGTCVTAAGGTANAGYNGAANTTLISGISLAPNETCTVTFIANVFPDVNVDPPRPEPGVFTNQAEVTGTGAETLQTPTDLSDDGSNPDTNGNGTPGDPGENDPTVLQSSFDSSITLLKTAALPTGSDPLQAGDEVTYSFTIENTGDLNLTNVALRDPLLGAGVIATIPSLIVGEIVVLTPDNSTVPTYALTQEDIDLGTVTNRAFVSGTDPYGREPTDDSEAVVGNDDDTVTPIPPFPALDLVKSAEFSGDAERAAVDDVITFRFRVENTGNQTITNIEIADPFPGLEFTGAPITPIASLAPGEFDDSTYVATYVITEEDIARGSIINAATVTGNPPGDADPIEDGSRPPELPEASDDGPTTVPLTRVPELTTLKTQEFDNVDGADSIGDIVNYTITVQNTGNVVLSDVAITDTLTDLTGAPLELDADPVFVSADLDSPEGDLLVGEIATYTASFTLNEQAINARGISNTVLAIGNGTDGNGPAGDPVPVEDTSDDGDTGPSDTGDDPTVLPLSGNVTADGLSMTKTTPFELVRRGDVVPYTITVSNDNSFVQGPLTLIDRLPNGMIPIPGSATIDGVEADATFTAGRVTWTDLSVPAFGETVVTVDARVLNGTRAGNLTNRATLIDPETGQAVLPDATATVRIEPEGVFECSDIIGKVFNDVNGNGYQDAPSDVDRTQITDQSFLGGKGKLSPVEVIPDETGLPGVRVATVDGLIITTDENGLFSVPCASLPATGGSNYILKVDERSLPAGYRMTTENPRVSRVTPGTMSEMNFGAAVALQVVRVDLTAASFVQTDNGAAMSPALRSGLQNVLTQIAGSPSTMALTFYLSPDANEDEVRRARALLDLVEDQVKTDWRDIGQVRLRIEQSIARTGQ